MGLEESSTQVLAWDREASQVMTSERAAGLSCFSLPMEHRMGNTENVVMGKSEQRVRRLNLLEDDLFGQTLLCMCRGKLIVASLRRLDGLDR